MTDLLRKQRPRQIVLGTITLNVVVCAWVVHYFVLPAYDEWRSLSSQAYVQAQEYAKLTANVAVRDSVEEEFKKLGPEIEQSESDQITLSQFLRDVEVLARLPSVMVINMKPLPVEDKGTYKIYPVRLSVAGKLQEILQFVSGVTNRPVVAGLEAFALRGIQGSNMVECTVSVWMVRLVSPPDVGADRTDVPRTGETGAPENG